LTTPLRASCLPARRRKEIVAHGEALGLDVLECLEHVTGDARLAAVAFEAGHDMAVTVDLVIAKSKDPVREGKALLQRHFSLRYRATYSSVNGTGDLDLRQAH
jgi:hypothetical protein